MSIATVAPAFYPQWTDDDGVPLAGGSIATYEAGTTTPVAVYTDSGLTVPFSNPIVLDSAGRASGPIFPPVSPAIKYVVSDSNSVVVATIDSIIASAPAS